MCCRECERPCIWIDRFGCCFDCSTIPFDTYGTEILVALHAALPSALSVAQVPDREKLECTFSVIHTAAAQTSTPQTCKRRPAGPHSQAGRRGRTSRPRRERPQKRL